MFPIIEGHPYIKFHQNLALTSQSKGHHKYVPFKTKQDKMKTKAKKPPPTNNPPKTIPKQVIKLEYSKSSK